MKSTAKTAGVSPGMARYSMNLVLEVPEQFLMAESYMKNSIKFAIIEAVNAASRDDPFAQVRNVNVLRLSALKAKTSL